MNDIDIMSWLKERPKWQQYAAKKLFELEKFDDEFIDELAELCKKEVSNEFPNIQYELMREPFEPQTAEELRLISIEDIEGVNNLSPRKPLSFGKGNMSIIYGNNGSGKSSYVRLLKHVCSSRDGICGELYNNVFSSQNVQQTAKITFSQANIEKEYKWSKNDTCEKLHSIDIFDPSFNRVFMGSEDEVRYEPPALSFFTNLIEICDMVSIKIETETKAHVSKMPQLPSTLEESISSNWLEKLNGDVAQEDIDRYCSFTEEEDSRLSEVNQRISEKTPVEVSHIHTKKKNYINELMSKIRSYKQSLSEEKCNAINLLKKQYLEKEKVAKTANEDAFSDSKLEGVGSETWKKLWAVARTYSEEHAYTNNEFPVVDDGSICPLCQQPLTEEAKKRFISFESYLKNETQKEADEAKLKWENAQKNLPEIVDENSLKTIMDAAAIEDENIVNMIKNIVSAFRIRKLELLKLDDGCNLNSIDNYSDLISNLTNLSKEYETKAQKYLDDSKSVNKEILTTEKKNLQAKRWVSEQKDAITEEVQRLKKVETLNRANKKTSSNILSRKKGELAEKLITEAFIERFNNELSSLGAKHLKVDLVKTKVQKGKVLHSIKLRSDNKVPLKEILSEGEIRVVSIAAFLADVTGKSTPSPFVFDDPISSLDQDYEEAVIRRLCKLACERQIIVFTHRLAMLSLLQDSAKKMDIEPEIICIRTESWGSGEPSDSPLIVKKPGSALNLLISERLIKAKKIYNEEGKAYYEPVAKSLCSEFRILLERIIELNLLADVVQRYRREVHTKGKINKLARITEDDCTYLDELMTKYSCFEHSQPLEAPVALPEPDELKDDFTGLKNWISQFEAR